MTDRKEILKKSTAIDSETKLRQLTQPWNSELIKTSVHLVHSNEVLQLAINSAIATMEQNNANTVTHNMDTDQWQSKSVCHFPLSMKTLKALFTHSCSFLCSRSHRCSDRSEHDTLAQLLQQSRAYYDQSFAIDPAPYPIFIHHGHHPQRSSPRRRSCLQGLH